MADCLWLTSSLLQLTPSACQCSACGDKDAPCPSLLVGLDSERCHVGRCGEGEELWHGNLKFKCFERYGWQLFKEYFTQFLSVGSMQMRIRKSCRNPNYSITVTQQLQSQVWFYISSLSSLCMQTGLLNHSGVKRTEGFLFFSYFS